MDNNYEWINFYMELADKLLVFKNDRLALINKIKTIYRRINLKLPKLDTDSNPKDIDPFTVFGLFNKGISNANRIAIIKGIASEFGITAPVPASFGGVPVLNNLKATFYFFQERGEHDIDHLWSLFEAALSYADDGSEANKAEFCRIYNTVLKQPGIRWNITMGLYWIRPYMYVNLDSRNRWFIFEPGNMPVGFAEKIKPMLDKVPSAEQYLEVNELCKKALNGGKYAYRTLPELSYYAWVVSEKVNQEKRVEESGEKANTSKSAHIRWTRPIIQALRDLGGSGTPAEVRVRIVENEHLTQEEISATRGKTNVNKFENEVAFARNDLVAAGYIDKSIRGVWSLTEAGRNVEMTDELASNLYKNNHDEAVARHSGDSDALADSDVETVRYWVYAPGRSAAKWDECLENDVMLLGWGETGDLNAFDSKDEIKQKMKELYGGNSSYTNSAHATWQFSHDMRPGDIVFVKKGIYEILGRGVVTSDYEYNEDRTDGYNHIRHITWTHTGNWKIKHQSPQKTLTDITQYSDFVQLLKELFDQDVLDEEDDESATIYPAYSVDEFLDEVYMDEETYHDTVNVLKYKKNIILQGAPGVGKTYVAKRLAYSIMGQKDVNRVAMVQFHQSYSYEDFIMGFRPTETGYELKNGVFYTFCKKAEIDSDNDYFFIIDEINRGNLSKIFGELFMLIENDKRGLELQLLYKDEKFAVPKNVYIIGTMNTADRSLALLDYALRRRFAFVDIKPGFESEGFKSYKSDLDNPMFNRLISYVEMLNREISEDDSLGEGFCIGHSYFCNLKPDTVDKQVLSGIVEYELIPLLKEYWFDEPSKVREWSENLRSAVK